MAFSFSKNILYNSTVANLKSKFFDIYLFLSERIYVIDETLISSIKYIFLRQ